MNLRELWNTTQHSHTDIVVCDEHAKEFLVLNKNVVNGYAGETAIEEITATDDRIWAWVMQAPAVISGWRTQYGCRR